MPQRETLKPNVLEHWKGVNERKQPTLVPDDFLSASRGVYFGRGDNCVRIEGKVLTSFLPTAVLNFTVLGELAVLQLLGSVVTIPLSQLLGYLPVFPTPTPEEETMSQAIIQNSLAFGAAQNVATVATTLAVPWSPLSLPLNLIVSDPDSIITSLAASVITVPAGSYRFKAIKQFYGNSGVIKMRLFDITNNVELIQSQATTGTTGANVTLMVRQAFVGATQLKFQYSTATALAGAIHTTFSGAPGSQATTGNDIDFQVEILKEP
jgi:hypothetical protein